MAGIYSQGGSAGHRYAGWLETVEAKNFIFGGKVFNGSPSAIYVGSNLVWGSDWLTVAAQKAIRGAFGQRDGMAVINATNAYLTQLAASGQAGKDKATALAGFINEDPMMVCSLGLQPELTVLPAMPERLLVGDGTAWFSTGFIPLGSDLEFGVKFKILAAGQGNKGIYGKGSYSNQIANAIYATCWTPGGYPNLVMYGWQGHHGSWRGDTSGSKFDYLWDFHYILKSGACHFTALRDGEPSDDYSTTEQINYTDDGIPMYMFKGNNAGASKSAIAFGYAKQGGIEKFLYYPCIHNGVLGMVDIISKTWKGNEAGSGQFTEEFGYMQNGSWVTWTPSTP